MNMGSIDLVLGYSPYPAQSFLQNPICLSQIGQIVEFVELTLISQPNKATGAAGTPCICASSHCPEVVDNVTSAMFILYSAPD